MKQKQIKKIRKANLQLGAQSNDSGFKIGPNDVLCGDTTEATLFICLVLTTFRQSNKGKSEAW